MRTGLAGTGEMLIFPISPSCIRHPTYPFRTKYRMKHLQHDSLAFAFCVCVLLFSYTLCGVRFYVDTFDEVDVAFKKAVENGATPVLEPELEPWGQRTCYIADPEGNLIEIGSWDKPYEEKDS